MTALKGYRGPRHASLLRSPEAPRLVSSPLAIFGSYDTLMSDAVHLASRQSSRAEATAEIAHGNVSGARLTRSPIARALHAQLVPSSTISVNLAAHPVMRTAHGRGRCRGHLGNSIGCS